MISASQASMTGPVFNRINFVFLINLSRYTYHTENMKEQAFALRYNLSGVVPTFVCNKAENFLTCTTCLSPLALLIARRGRSTLSTLRIFTTDMASVL